MYASAACLQSVGAVLTSRSWSGLRSPTPFEARLVTSGYFLTHVCRSRDCSWRLVEMK